MCNKDTCSKFRLRSDTRYFTWRGTYSVIKLTINSTQCVAYLFDCLIEVCGQIFFIKCSYTRCSTYRKMEEIARFCRCQQQIENHFNFSYATFGAVPGLTRTVSSDLFISGPRVVAFRSLANKYCFGDVNLRTSDDHQVLGSGWYHSSTLIIIECVCRDKPRQRLINSLSPMFSVHFIETI